ncbi:MAG TPA: N-acetyltransferase, partial [Actinomycetota bacterium]
LVERCVSDLAGAGVQFLSVLTVVESEPDWRETDNYADTRAFYRALGFLPLRELALEGWDERAVILVRPVP